MSVDEVVKKAIDGGYEHDGDKALPIIIDPRDYKSSIDIERLVLRPIFWQSLGKAIGWKDHTRDFFCGECQSDEVETLMKGWEYEWHRLIHNLAEGKTIERFFAELNQTPSFSDRVQVNPILGYKPI